MRCVYLSGDVCYANLPIQLPEMFKPSPDDKSQYCEKETFRYCPRYICIQGTPAPAPTTAPTKETAKTAGDGKQQ